MPRKNDDLLLATWRLEGCPPPPGPPPQGSGSARLAFERIRDALALPEPPLCIYVEGAAGTGKTRCCAAAFEEVGACVQVWDSRECATSTPNSTQVVVRDASSSTDTRNDRRRSRRKKKDAHHAAKRRLLPSVGVDLFLRREEEGHVVVWVEDIHEVLRDDKSAFAAMLRTLRSAHGSNAQFSGARRTSVVVTVDRDELDHRLRAQLLRECPSLLCVTLEHPSPEEVERHLTAVLPRMTRGHARILRECSRMEKGVRGALEGFRERLTTVTAPSCPTTPLPLPPPPHGDFEAARLVAKARAASGIFSAMCRAHADDEGRPDALWRSMSDAMALQVRKCEELLPPPQSRR